MVDIFKALGDESRLRIMNILMNKMACVCEIEQALDLSQTNVSRHLYKLKYAGLVKSEKKAQWIYYDINREFFDGNPELLQYLKNEFVDDTRFQDDLQNYTNIKSDNCGKPGGC